MIIKPYQERIENYMQQVMPAPDTPPAHLHEAMHYAVFSGGKRIRPILVYLSGSVFQADPAALDPAAAAIECIHTYSLIHDDLPAMDDDDYRRGQPTVHKIYGDATAILAGNALQSLAFEIISLSCPPIVAKTLAHASGSQGLLGGQELDLHKHTSTKTAFQEIDLLKTAALFEASAQIGAIISNCSPEQLPLFQEFGRYIGLAYQAQDDLLDQDNPRTPQSITALFDQALNTLEKINGNTEYLKVFCDFVRKRID